MKSFIEHINEEEEIIHELTTKMALDAGLYVDVTNSKQNNEQAFKSNNKIFVTKTIYQLRIYLQCQLILKKYF